MKTIAKDIAETKNCTISAEEALLWIKRRSSSIIIGVPCSWLSSLITAIESEPQLTYIAAANEALAVGIAAGIYLSGKRATVICQNSGTGFILNPIASLLHPYKIPVDFIVSNRVGTSDEPQHQVMERVAESILRSAGVRTFDYVDEAACESDDNCKALIVKNKLEHKNGLSRNAINIQPTFQRHFSNCTKDIFSEHGHPREYWIRILSDLIDAHDLILSTTGYTSRDLYNINDRAGNFYMMGSMGCIGAIAYGVSLNCSRKIFILDGDGALLMHLGQLATIGQSENASICYILFNNSCYASTGGQPTSSSAGLFARTALATGFPFVSLVAKTDDFVKEIKRFSSTPSLSFIECKTTPSETKSRIKLEPYFIAQRFRRNFE